ncbi:MAG: FtsQ-type POTRA domain-containing protein [Coriobacteriia bacterium]|nr:FtsQ-type POTRA domain-containing protein [Coriobacteriia bacterium]
MRSTRIGDLNRGSARNGGRNGGGRKAAVVLGILGGLAAVVAVALVVLSSTGAFVIKGVVTKGVSHLTDQEMAQLAAVPEGSTLLTIDTEAVRRNLLRDAWIKDASVIRLFPDKLELAVTERTIQAVVEVQSSATSKSQQWAIASDGRWLMPIPDQDSEAGKATSAQVYEDAAKVMHIQNILVSAEPQIGEPCGEESVNNALSIISGMSTELADQVKTIVASDADSTTLVLENGVEIAFGTADDIRNKERVCLELMKQYEGSIAYINVRSVDRPTWRSA